MEYKIVLDAGILGGASLTDFRKFCANWNCEVCPPNRVTHTITITTDDPTNFYWLGANMYFKYKDNLSESLSSKILGHDGA